MGEEVAYSPAQEQKQIFPGGALEPAKFLPTILEWLWWKGSQIVMQKSSDGVIYEVPKGNVLFITSAWCSGSEVGAVSSHASVGVLLRGSGFDEIAIIGNKVDHATGQHGGNDSNSISFPFPIRLLPGGLVEAFEVALINPKMQVGFTGFLVANPDLPSF